jgi:hypothetical protein
MKVKLWVQVDDYEVALVFTWDEFENAWVCKMEDDFMKELGPVPYQKEEQ